MLERHLAAHRDLIAGLILLAIGLAVFAGSFSYEIGSLARMGPGFFPMLLGILLCLLALSLVVQSLTNSREANSMATTAVNAIKVCELWRPLTLILLSIVGFALLVRSAGLPVAGLVCAILAGYADRSNRFFSIVLVALTVSISTSILFGFVFRLPVKLLPF